MEAMVAQDVVLTHAEYKKIARLVYDRFGIHLGDKKESLVSNRLRKVLVAGGFSTFDKYYQYLINDRSGKALDVLINKISTNLTFFGREAEHFLYLKDTVIPAFHEAGILKRERKLRIWCAGCSTGEEAYTLAITAREALREVRSDIDFGILATDISGRALDVAEKGIYKRENVEKMDREWLKKYYDRVDDNTFSVKKEIREKVLFRRLNLMRPEFPFKNRFHVIFCRNVMIYFDQKTRQQLTARFHKNIFREGYLFIGHSESLGRDNRYFSYVKPAVYKRSEE